MIDKQYVALYVYGPVDLVFKADGVTDVKRLTFDGTRFWTVNYRTIQEDMLQLAPGVYGWYASTPVSVAISGRAVLMTMQRSGKDPWPPPPPPPPTPDFDGIELAQRLWARHWVGGEGDFFMSVLAE